MKLIEFYKSLNISEFEYAEILKRLNREPNELETYLFSAMWSEHCGYKHSKNYISKLPLGGAVCSGENAGGIEIGDRIIVFKIESHNHPSAIEPFQGAATGIGGIIRDILAMGARPIALLDSLKFGTLSDPITKHLLNGVVAGISSYGNSIGVPTVAGEIGFDESYTDSPLVNVMAVGIVDKNKIISSKAEPGQVIIVLGSATGRDGIHGASFASKELTNNSKNDRPSVQIGDPFMKKILIEATLEILCLEEVQSCQDFGAAGLLSSSVEMCYKGQCGINLELDKLHLREKDMKPWEIMLSESQERMLFITKPEGATKILGIAQKFGIPARIIGCTTEGGFYKLFWQGKELASLPPGLLCNPITYQLSEEKPCYIDDYADKSLDRHTSIYEAVKKVVADPNFASKKWVYTQYDHMVGNRTSVKPGEAGSAGLWIFEDGGILGLTIDSNPRQVFLDPYNGARNTVWECFRNLVSAGIVPLGVTNCLNYGNPNKGEVSYQFVKSIGGIADACNEINIPVVSGNVSFYNESTQRRVYPTPTIGMLGYQKNIKSVIKSRFTRGETIILIGKSINNDSHIGGSLYQKVLYDFIGGKVDIVDAKLEIILKDTLFYLIDKKIIAGCVDISEGGLFCALFEAIRNGNIGFNGSLIFIEDEEKALFGEICTRYLISTVYQSEVIRYLEDNLVPYKVLGICEGNSIEFNGYKFETEELFESYDNSISRKMDE